MVDNIDVEAPSRHESRLDKDVLKTEVADEGYELFEEGESILVLGCTGRDKQIPELSNEVPYDAYRADVFALGNLYYKEFISVGSHFYSDVGSPFMA